MSKEGDRIKRVVNTPTDKPYIVINTNINDPLLGNLPIYYGVEITKKDKDETIFRR